MKKIIKSVSYVRKVRPRPYLKVFLDRNDYKIIKGRLIPNLISSGLLNPYTTS